jgi:hypothetical protein
MKLYIKYMVSLRCRMLVRAELKRLGYELVVLDSGTVEILDEIVDEKRELFAKKINSVLNVFTSPS